MHFSIFFFFFFFFFNRATYGLRDKATNVYRHLAGISKSRVLEKMLPLPKSYFNHRVAQIDTKTICNKPQLQWNILIFLSNILLSFAKINFALF